MSEMPTVVLPSPANMMIYNGEDGYMHSEPVTADMIDLRFEDYKKYGRQAPLGVKYFAAPLANGQWLNITLQHAGFGDAVVDSKPHRQINPKTMRAEEYLKISTDWATFGEFLNGRTVVKQAVGEADRRANDVAG